MGGLAFPVSTVSDAAPFRAAGWWREVFLASSGGTSPYWGGGANRGCYFRSAVWHPSSAGGSEGLSRGWTPVSRRRGGNVGSLGCCGAAEGAAPRVPPRETPDLRAVRAFCAFTAAATLGRQGVREGDKQETHRGTTHHSARKAAARLWNTSSSSNSPVWWP